MNFSILKPVVLIVGLFCLTASYANPINSTEMADWKKVKNENTLSAYQSYLQKYPKGQYQQIAQLRIKELGGNTPQPQQTTTQKQSTASNEELMSKGMWQDPKTGLVWMRCSLGQTWNGKTCLGEVEAYTWDNAFKAVEALNRQGFGGYTDWQLPHIEDLFGLVYCSTGFEKTATIPTKAGGTKTIKHGCKGENYQRPTINLSIFPNTPPDNFYWSSSPYANGNRYAWLVYFGYGYSYNGDKYINIYVRAVRSGQ